jgi:photosystem II stability/assembly factor-like uncharacterized protein
MGFECAPLRRFLALAGLLLLLVTAMVSRPARGHDASSYGGVFRSRDLGEKWLNADVGLFLNAALSVAVDPRDPAHLLLGTDLGLLRSRNGGRSWAAEAPDRIFGAVFAAAFGPGGSAVCAAQSGVFLMAGERWDEAQVPAAAIPVRALVFAQDGRRIYLVGRNRLFASDDGRSYAALPDPAGGGAVTALVVGAAPETPDREILVAVTDGRVMRSADRGRSWRPTAPGDGPPVDTIAPDAHAPQRLWLAQADRLQVSDDLGATWRAVGRPLPQPGTIVRGIAASADAGTVVVTSQRGTWRSATGGQDWQLAESGLPAHLEAGPLARDPGDPRVLYAVYSLLPYAEMWRAAVEGGSVLTRLDPVSLLGGAAFCLLLVIGGALVVQRLARLRAAAARP